MSLNINNFHSGDATIAKPTYYINDSFETYQSGSVWLSGNTQNNTTTAGTYFSAQALALCTTANFSPAEIQSVAKVPNNFTMKLRMVVQSSMAICWDLPRVTSYDSYGGPVTSFSRYLTIGGSGCYLYYKVNGTSYTSAGADHDGKWKNQWRDVVISQNNNIVTVTVDGVQLMAGAMQWNADGGDYVVISTGCWAGHDVYIDSIQVMDYKK